jgi:hypothetical protein
MLYDSEDWMRANVMASQPAYAEARERKTRGYSQEAIPRITTLLTALGHSPENAVEIVRIAQRSWSKELQLAD